jgi:hypothetical protein
LRFDIEGQLPVAVGNMVGLVPPPIGPLEPVLPPLLFDPRDALPDALPEDVVIPEVVLPAPDEAKPPDAPLTGADPLPLPDDEDSLCPPP